MLVCRLAKHVLQGHRLPVGCCYHSFAFFFVSIICNTYFVTAIELSNALLGSLETEALPGSSGKPTDACFGR